MSYYKEMRILGYSLKHHLRAVIFSTKVGRALEKRILQLLPVPDFSDSPVSYLPTVKAILNGFSIFEPGQIQYLSALEIGTGRHLAVPLILRFLGMREITTVDAQDMLLIGQIKSMAFAIANNPELISFARSHQADVDEGRALFASLEAEVTMKSLLNRLGIRFISNVDLRSTSAVSALECPVPDLIFSNNVLEHIPANHLTKILLSLSRVFVNKKQLHIVDLGDHFADVMPDLHPLHNYRYKSLVWTLLSDNRYLYTNRLTLTDYDSLLQNIGVEYNIKVIEFLQGEEYEIMRSFVASEFIGKKIGATRLEIDIN